MRWHGLKLRATTKAAIQVFGGGEMRDYGKVHTGFWVSEDTRALSDDGKLLALYLLTCPHANIIGCFRLPQAYVADDLGWNAQRVAKGFAELSGKGFATHDASGWLCIHRYLKWNAIENPNQATAAKKVFEQIPDRSAAKAACALAFREFAERVDESIYNRFETVSGTLSKPLLNQEQEQEQEQEQQPEKNLVPQQAGEPAAKTMESAVFDHWRQVMDSPRSKLDDKRAKLIKAALKWGYTPEQLCKAIDGCRVTPHNMGINDRGEKYNGIHIILRDGGQIDRFMRNADNPPKFMSKQQVRQAANGQVSDGSLFMADVPPEYREPAGMADGFDGMTFEG